MDQALDRVGGRSLVSTLVRSHSATGMAVGAEGSAASISCMGTRLVPAGLAQTTDSIMQLSSITRSSAACVMRQHVLERAQTGARKGKGVRRK